MKIVKGEKVRMTELIIYTDHGQNTISIEPWQLYAIQQVLGLEINGSEVSMFTKDFVATRLKKMGLLAGIENNTPES